MAWYSSYSHGAASIQCWDTLDFYFLLLSMSINAEGQGQKAKTAFAATATNARMLNMHEWEK